MLLNRQWDNRFWLGMGVLVILLSKECSLAKDTPQRVTTTTRNREAMRDLDHGAEMLNAWKIVIAGLILLPCVFLYIIRGLQRHRRRLLVEVLCNHVPAVVLAFPTNDHRSDGRSTEDDRVEESEAASLLSSSGVQTAKPSNAVLVVDPMGNIEMGVRQERDDQNEDLEL